ncbi:hypothetical protein ABH944_008116 [Caballeronia udeis]|uniref:Uncharacterized protein n=1 Tax=Caballeronia udeis TaxID=1232866 RepID=A0ABW8MYS2_9BURK
MNDRFKAGEGSHETLLFLQIALAHCCMGEMEHQWSCRHISYAGKAG